MSGFRYTFMNITGCEMWSYEEPQAVGNNTETVMAIQKLFTNLGPPPESAIYYIGRTQEGYEQWCVGPFDILVNKEALT